MPTKKEMELIKSGAMVRKDNSAKLKDSNIVKEAEVFDLASLTLEQLARDIKASYDKKEPVLIVFKKRQVKKLTLDRERQGLLLDRVKWLRLQGEELMKLRADALLSEQTVMHLIQSRELEAQQEIERAISIHELGLHQDSTDKQILNSRVREAEAQARKLELENETEEVKIQFLKDFFAKVNIESLPPALQTHIISIVIDNNSSAFGDFENKQILNEYLSKQLDQDVRKKTYEADNLKSQARSTESQADIDRAKADKSTNRMKD